MQPWIDVLEMSGIPLDFHRFSCSFGLASSLISPSDEHLLQYDIPAMKKFYMENSMILMKTQQVIREKLKRLEIHENEVLYLQVR